MHHTVEIAMNVNDVMSKTVVSVEMDDRLAEVKKIFDHTQFHHLLVIENGQLVGIISDRDLFKAISPNIGTPAASTGDEATLNKKAHQIMSRKPVTISEDATLEQAIALMNLRQVSCLPAIDPSNKPSGILSWRDILKSLVPA